ncbi:MAG: metallophosphatase domain-containing protein [Lewinellaceae bacterium]|nr:metallophosphatase domain-containing protein [Lewinellaceae bacterium]
MRFVFISDTHCKHEDLQLPVGDVLVHAGDFTRRGREHEAADFLDWFAQQPFRYKVLIAGNHDFIAEQAPKQFRAMLPDSITYLENSGGEIEGIRLWGSPITPWFFNWAFNRHRGAPIRPYWQAIPAGTDIVITHGPPYGILDEVVRDPRPVGCRDLLHRIREIKPRVHLFGHIHEGYGCHEEADTLFINASVLDVRYALVNAPVVWDAA